MTADIDLWRTCKWCEAPIYQDEDGIWTHGHGGGTHCVTTFAEPAEEEK